MRAVAVRVVPVSERRWLGQIVGWAGGIATFMTTMEVPTSPFGNRYLAIGLALFVWNFGMLLPRRPKPFTTRIVSEEIVVRVGARSFLRDGRTRATAAPAPRGWSIAIAPETGAPFFVEAETEADARAVLAAFDVPWPGSGAIDVVIRRDRVRLIQRASAVIGALGGFLYFFWVGLLDDMQFKPVGLVGLSGLLSSVLFVFDPLLRRRVRLGEERAGGAAVGHHIGVHADMGDVEEGAEAGDTTEAPRFRVFVRGDETTEAWLTRIDVVGERADGYRGDGVTRDELLALLDDDRADALARLGAARLLARRHGETAGTLARRVAPDLGARVRAVVIDDVEAAAESFDRIGPAFVAHRA